MELGLEVDQPGTAGWADEEGVGDVGQSAGGLSSYSPHRAEATEGLLTPASS